MNQTIVADPVGTAIGEFRQRNTADTKRVQQAVAKVEVKIAQEYEKFHGEWGVAWNHKQRDDVPGHEAAKRALADRLRPLKAELSDLRAQLEQLPYTLEAGLRLISATTEVGPWIAVPPVDLPVVADDPEIRRLTAARAGLLTDQQQVEVDRPLVEHALREATTRAETVAARVRVGVADAGDVKTADRARHDASQVLTKIDTQLAANARRLSEIGDAMLDREAALDAERRSTAAREVKAAAFKAADALVAAMATMTALERWLNAASDTSSPFSSLPALSCDNPRSLGREFLQTMLEQDWQPSKRQ